MIGRAAIVVWAAACAAAVAAPAAAEPPPADDNSAVAVSAVAPRALASEAVRRLGGEIAEAKVKCRDAAPAERETAARRWLDEVFAPLAAPDCQEVLTAAGLPGATRLADKDALFPTDRPIAAAPAADEVLAPDALPPLSAEDVSQLRAFGLIPFELALAGECARVVGAGHVGPPPKDPLLRLARAARLEGLARLAGLILAARSAGIEPAQMGLVALSAGKDRAGITHALLDRAGSDPVRAALVRTFQEDGLRWALFHYLRGGLSAVLAALERPAAGPEELLRPGAPRARASDAHGCRLGPRAAAALLTAQDDADWADVLVADRWTSDGEGRVAIWLQFESETAASRVQKDLAGRGVTAEQDGVVLTALLRRSGKSSRPSP